MNIRHASVETVLGQLTVVAEDERVTGLYFPHHWYRPDSASLGSETTAGADPLLARAAAELHEYLAGERRSFDVPLATRGDSFQEQVWTKLTEIPFGHTTTYGDVAEALGDKSLAQRVGQAVGRNPLCVFIPCHRVVGAGGRLTGYAGGLARKRTLLELEEPSMAKEGRLF